MKKNANKGFSLVELIIVIAIMAVLIGVLAPQFIKQVEKSRESTDLQNVEEMKTAVETYTAEHEGLASDVTVEWSKTSGKIEVKGGVTSSNLSDYGITGDIALKSKEWEECKWTYDKTKYSWTLTTNGKAKYFKADGSAATTTP